MDHVKQAVAAGLGFGALVIPGFAAIVTALGGDAAIMQAALGAFSVYKLGHALVEYVHGKATGGKG